VVVVLNLEMLVEREREKNVVVEEAGGRMEE